MSEYTDSAIGLVQEYLSDVVYNLSYTLRDYEGMITDNDAHFILKNLQISPAGVILSSISNPVHPGDSELSQDVFMPILSNRAVNTFYLVSNFDTGVVYKPDSVEDKLSSLLFNYTDILTIEQESMMSYLYLELYSLYTSLVSYQQGSLFPMTLPELDTILSNIRAMSTSIEGLGDALDVYETLSVLRYMQRAILLVKSNIPRIVG